MNKIWTIIQREYLTRVKSKLFLVSTLLTPLGFAALMIIPILSAENVEKEVFKVFVNDGSGEILDRLENDSQFTFHESSMTPEVAKTTIGAGEALLTIPTDLRSPVFNLHSESRLNLQTKKALDHKLDKAFRRHHLAEEGIQPEVLERANSHSFSLVTKPFQDEGNVSTSTEVASIVGYILGFMIYFMVMIYGIMVMRGVMEEKTNRIVEVMVSSVKPFQLMMGKIIGIGAVGITQVFLWGILSIGGSMLVVAMLGVPDAGAMDTSAMASQAPDFDPAAQAQIIEQVIGVFTFSNVMLFLFYFLGGYLIYGSLFAAVGSAVDTQEDSQQLTFPVVLPLIIPTLFMANIIQNPNGGIAKFFSMFPLFSPIVMMMRKVSTEVPWWELTISVLGVILGFVGTVWVAAKIYRIGILMYGKKIKLKELAKWVVQ